jgi:hypothetical protein
MLTTQTADPTPVVRTNFFDPTNRTAYAVLSEQCGVPASTLCDRAHGRQLRREKIAKQQYLTLQEEKACCELG